MDTKRRIKWVRLEAFTSELGGKPSEVLERLTDALYKAQLAYPNQELMFDFENVGEYSDSYAMTLKVRSEESDDEYNRRLQGERNQEEYRRKQYEQLKKEFGDK